MASSPEIKDQQISEAFLRGDPAAHKTIDDWIDTVLRDRFLSLRADWEDLKQEVRVRLYRNLAGARFDGRSGLRTYVHSIARNVCVDSSRLAYRRRETSDVMDSVDRPGLTGETTVTGLIHRDLLLKIMRGVPRRDRLLLRLVVLERYSYAEVAERLGLSQAVVKGRVARCKARLIECYDRLIRMGGRGE